MNRQRGEMLCGPRFVWKVPCSHFATTKTVHATPVIQAPLYTMRLFIGLLNRRLMKATCIPDTASTARHSIRDHHLTRRFVLVTAAAGEGAQVSNR